MADFNIARTFIDTPPFSYQTRLFPRFYCKAQLTPGIRHKYRPNIFWVVLCGALHRLCISILAIQKSQLMTAGNTSHDDYGPGFVGCSPIARRRHSSQFGRRSPKVDSKREQSNEARSGRRAGVGKSAVLASSSFRTFCSLARESKRKMARAKSSLETPPEPPKR